MATVSNPKAQGICAALSEVLGRYPGVRFAFLFGSVARGQDGPLSDIDIAVSHDPPGELPATLRGEIASALRTESVDLVLLESAGPLLRHRIFRDGVPILVRDEMLLLRSRYRAQLDYLDTSWLRKLWWKEFKERWREGAPDGP